MRRSKIKKNRLVNFAKQKRSEPRVPRTSLPQGDAGVRHAAKTRSCSTHSDRLPYGAGWCSPQVIYPDPPFPSRRGVVKDSNEKKTLLMAYETSDLFELHRVPGHRKPYQVNQKTHCRPDERTHHDTDKQGHRATEEPDSSKTQRKRFRNPRDQE